MKKGLIVAAAVVVGLSATVVLAGFRGPMGHGFGHRPGPEHLQRFVNWRLDALLADLDATDAQRTQVYEIKDGLFADGQQVMQSHQAAREQFLAQWDAAQPDAAAVHRLVDERADAMRQLAHKAADAALELHRTLTPEQRQKLSTELREHAAEH